LGSISAVGWIKLMGNDEGLGREKETGEEKMKR
jgi:hypothetical protein